jgi:hypothetical protein
MSMRTGSDWTFFEATRNKKAHERKFVGFSAISW